MADVADVALASLLRVAVMRLARRLRTEDADSSMSASQVAVLGTLDHNGLVTVGELAARERVQPPSMTRIVGCLEARGLVRRTQDPDDRRRVLVGINDQGRDVLSADRRRRDDWLAHRLTDLTSDELGLLRDVLALCERLAQA